MAEMTSSPESDTRFQYEVIRNLGESVREMARVMAGIQTTQVGMLERLARIEANRVSEDVAKMDGRLNAVCEKVDKLERHVDIEEGMRGARKAVIFYWPAIAALGCLILFILVAAGILTIPSTQKPPVIVNTPPPIIGGNHG